MPRARRGQRERLPDVSPFRVRLVEDRGRGIYAGTIDDGELAGEAIDVAFGLLGEVVMVELLGRDHGRWQGRVRDVIEPSPKRIEPGCVHFGTCGGCQLQHMSYADQLERKRRDVQAALSVAGIDEGCVQPVLPAETVYEYRNHARFSVGRRERELGFTTYLRHRFLPIDACPLLDGRINEVLHASQGQVAGHQLAVRVGTRTGDLLVQPRQDGPDLPFASGQPSLTEELCDRSFRVSAAAFFQVNTRQAERLIDAVGEGLELRADDILLDLYCGVGTFGISLARRVRRVIGIEESPAALADAAHNSVGLQNIDFHAGKAEDLLPSWRGTVSAAIVDPPRCGCRPEALHALAALAPNRLAYVSCNPETLGRDLALLIDDEFVPRYVQPVDMFPQTAHVECVAILERRHN